MGATNMEYQRWRKWTLVTAGVVSTGLGLVGIVLPLLPTTPFLLLAAACFVRSSSRLYNWLISHKWFGPHIRNYREHKAIAMNVKLWTIALLWGTISYTAFGIIKSRSVQIVLLVIALGVTAHVLSMKTLTKEMASSSKRPPVR